MDLQQVLSFQPMVMLDAELRVAGAHVQTPHDVLALSAIIQPAWKSKVMVIEFEFIADYLDESARIVVSEPENQQRLEAAVTLSDPDPTGQHIPDGLCLRGR